MSKSFIVQKKNYEKCKNPKVDWEKNIKMNTDHETWKNISTECYVGSATEVLSLLSAESSTVEMTQVQA